MLAIVFPDQESTLYLMTQVTVQNTQHVGDMCFVTVKYSGKEFLIIISGYGKVNIARAITIACQNYKIDALLGIGTGGSLDLEKARLCSAVICSSALQYDVNFRALGECFVTLPEMKKGIYHACPKMQQMAISAALGQHICCTTGRIVSDDRFVNCDVAAQKLCDCYGGLCVDCECGALGQMAYMLQLPFTAIKVIADDSGCCAAKQYKENEQKALLIAQKAALSYMKQTT